MISQHYDEAALVALLDSPGAESDVHLVECTDCRRSFEEYQAVTSCLGEQAVWDLRVLKEDPVPQTIQNIRAFADRMRDEDAAALPLVAELLAGPRDQWMPRLQSDPKYRTAGVVRKLMEASDKAIDVMPPDALEISALATEIADHLDPAAYPSDTVMKLRGNAWRDRGFCLYYAGTFDEARLALENARTALGPSIISDHDFARVDIATALNERAFDDYEISVSYSRHARATFEKWGDIEKMMSAALAGTNGLLKSARAQEALTELRSLFHFAESVSSDTYGRFIANVAYAYRELGDFQSALSYFQCASEAFDAANSKVERVRIDSNIAELLLLNGHVSEGERRIRLVMDEFERLGMEADATGAALSLAEAAASRRDFAEVEVLCTRALTFLRSVGIGIGERAQVAISYLQEVARSRRIAPTDVKYVRNYISRVFDNRPVLFAPPPSE